MVDRELPDVSSQIIVPIICEGNTIGAIALMSMKPKVKFGDMEKKLAITAATYLGHQMEGGNVMDVFSDYLASIENGQHRARAEAVLDWIKNSFPELKPKFAWNQPMFTEHGTFIIGFSVSKLHLAVSPEYAGMKQFMKEITEAGYDTGKMLFRIKWEEPVDYILLEKIIRFNCLDKAECKTFWRK